MSKRYGMLYGDGSMNLCPDGQDLDRARREMAASICDGDTQLIEVEIQIIHFYGLKEVPRHEHSITCPTCHEEIPIA